MRSQAGGTDVVTGPSPACRATPPLRAGLLARPATPKNMKYGHQGSKSLRLWNGPTSILPSNSDQPDAVRLVSPIDRSTDGLTPPWPP